MKFTKPISFKGIDLPAALFSLRYIIVNIESQKARLSVAVYASVSAEADGKGALRDAPYPHEWVIQNQTNDDGTPGPQTFINQVLPAMSGDNMMARIRAYVKTKVGPDGCVDIDED